MAFASPAQAYPPASTLSVLSGGAVSFTTTNNTSTSFPATSTLSLSANFSTSVTTGAGQIAVLSPAALTGSAGASIGAALISVTCNVNGATGYTGHTVALVGGGTSGACVTVGPSVHNGAATITVTFTIDAAVLIADTYLATAGFSFVGTQS